MDKPYDIGNDIDKNRCGFFEWNKPRYLLGIKDKRDKKFRKFKSKHGFTPDECWCLSSAICIFILPRLKYFRETIKNVGVHPACFDNSNDWLKVLDKMIYAFKWMLDEDKIPYDNPKKETEFIER